LTYVLAGPRFHRVHHSLASKHRDKNFASFFPVLDLLFGTAYFPRQHETITTGLADKREPRTVAQYLIALAPRRNPEGTDKALDQSTRNLTASAEIAAGTP
jgi:sterol desaturase/sphingolipid hydroxylase (fatty acid hydroxylase superfamily)